VTGRVDLGLPVIAGADRNGVSCLQGTWECHLLSNVGRGNELPYRGAARAARAAGRDVARLRSGGRRARSGRGAAAQLGGGAAAGLSRVGGFHALTAADVLEAHRSVLPPEGARPRGTRLTTLFR